MECEDSVWPCMRYSVEALKQHVHELLSGVGDRPRDAGLVEHLRECQACSRVVEAYALMLGLGSASDASSPGLDALRGRYSHLTSAGGLRRTWHFTMRDRALIIRDVTDVIRLFDTLNCTFMSAVACNDQATIQFTIEGSDMDVVQFNAEWPQHRKRIESTTVGDGAIQRQWTCEMGVRAKGPDREDVVSRFVSRVAFKYQANMRCFRALVARGAGRAYFDLEARILCRDEHHKSQISAGIRDWIGAGGGQAWFVDAASIAPPRPDEFMDASDTGGGPPSGRLARGGANVIVA